jgi:hypothetical protein
VTKRRREGIPSPPPWPWQPLVDVVPIEALTGIGIEEQVPSLPVVGEVEHVPDAACAPVERLIPDPRQPPVRPIASTALGPT